MRCYLLNICWIASTEISWKEANWKTNDWSHR